MSGEYLTPDYIDGIGMPTLKHVNSLNVLSSLKIGLTYLAMLTRQRAVEFLSDSKEKTHVAAWWYKE